MSVSGKGRQSRLVHTHGTGDRLPAKASKQGLSTPEAWCGHYRAWLALSGRELMRVSRLSVVVVSALLVGALTPVETALADPVTPPSATIVTPASGSGAEGVITITAT